MSSIESMKERERRVIKKILDDLNNQTNRFSIILIQI
jgi:hypothetical protein